MCNQTFQAINKIEQIEHTQRIKERREQQARKKEANHWIFVAGTLVSKYLKEDLGIAVYKGEGAAAKNATSFAPLENILAYLSTHKEFTAQIAMQPGESSPDL